MNIILNEKILADQQLITQINYKLADISEQLKLGKIKLEKIRFAVVTKDKYIMDIYLSNKNIIERLKNYIWGIQDCEIKLTHDFYPKQNFFDGTTTDALIEVGIIITPIKKKKEDKMIKADLLVNLEELKHYELLSKIAIHEQISLFEAIDFVLSKLEITNAEE